MTDRRRPGNGFVGLLRGAAVASVVVGAAGSVELMLRAGHPPLFLRVLFTGWVLSPFVGLVVAFIAAKRWPAPTRATLHGIAPVIALGSLACYGGMVALPSGARPAFVFLVVPFGSWLLLALALLISTAVARRSSRRAAGA